MLPDHPKNALPQGHLLAGEYRIEAVLGAGGFGITYLAEDRLGQRVAVKEYMPRELAVRLGDSTAISPVSRSAQADFDWGRRKFEEEGRKLAAFRHPHINRVLRLFEAHGTAYLVLEHVPGPTLSQCLAAGDGTLPAPQLQRLLAELLDALRTVHGAGLVHCDVKPSNIIIRDGRDTAAPGAEDGAAVLLDFGASRQAITQHTRSAVAAYTAPYAAPEQYEGAAANLGPWTDLYALGVVAYRCISGLTERDLPDALTRA